MSQRIYITQSQNSHHLHRIKIENIYGDRKVTQPIPDACYICQKINYIEIRKQKTMLY
jgi:hypothetical protein